MSAAGVQCPCLAEWLRCHLHQPDWVRQNRHHIHLRSCTPKDIANTMVVVGRSSHQFKEQWFNTGMPLTMLIQQQLENPFGCPVLTMSMKAHMTGSSEEVAELSSSGAPLTVAEATSGKYRILFMQPEASVTDSGQRLLRELSRMDVIRGLVVDEVHQVHRRRSIKLIGICSELRNRDQYPR